MKEDKVCCPRCKQISNNIILEPHPVKWGLKINCPNCGIFYSNKLKTFSKDDKTNFCKTCKKEFLEEEIKENMCYYCTKKIKI